MIFLRGTLFGIFFDFHRASLWAELGSFKTRQARPGNAKRRRITSLSTAPNPIPPRRPPPPRAAHPVNGRNPGSHLVRGPDVIPCERIGNSNVTLFVFSRVHRLASGFFAVNLPAASGANLLTPHWLISAYATVDVELSAAWLFHILDASLRT